MDDIGLKSCFNDQTSSWYLYIKDSKSEVPKFTFFISKDKKIKLEIW